MKKSKFEKLEALIKELNSDTVIEDEVFESQFNFKFDGKRLYDSNENFDCYYEDTMDCLRAEVEAEFGYQCTENRNSTFDRIKEALPKGYGIDWEDNVAMTVCKID